MFQSAGSESGVKFGNRNIVAIGEKKRDDFVRVIIKPFLDGREVRCDQTSVLKEATRMA